MVNSNVDSAAFQAALVGLPSTSVRKGPPCGVARILEQLDEGPRDALVAALGNPAILHVAIADLLGSFGFEIKAGTVARHRRAGTSSGCRCQAAQ